MTHLNPVCASDFHGMGANMNDRLPHKKDIPSKEICLFTNKKTNKIMKPVQLKIKIKYQT